MVAGYFLLLAQKKVTKEKGTLAAAVCRHPCRQTSRAGSGVRSRHVPVPRSDARASCARPRAVHAAVSSTCSPRPRGTREEQSAAVPAAEASVSHISGASAFRFRVPLSSGEGRTDQPRAPHAGGARDRADFDNRPWLACGRNPSARSEPSAQPRARIRGRVLFGYFLLHEQEKVTRPPGWRTEKHTDVSRLSRQTRNPSTHHPHPTLPLKGRAKAEPPGGTPPKDKTKSP